MKTTAVITRGVEELDLDMSTMQTIHEYALGRYVRDKDGFNTFTPNGINVEITDGNDLIEVRLLSEIRIGERLYCIIDDYGPDSQEGLVATILLPEEY